MSKRLEKKKSNSGLMQKLAASIDEQRLAGNEVAGRLHRDLDKTVEYKSMSVRIDEETVRFLTKQTDITNKVRREADGLNAKNSSPTNELRESVFYLRELSEKLGVTDIKAFINVIIDSPEVVELISKLSKEEFN